ncbi:DoxX family protein [Nocardia farcinica]|uniref:DoxX family protein n=1 Tax=Nocardia farcinica TaxID=37329 RepID=UPI00245714B4|nr:DoxX family protein [Nocardia farcinica]
MSEKPNETSAGTPADAEPAVSKTGRGVTSPMDSPTEQFPAMKLSERDVPRTDEELGLDPDVPTTGERAAVADTAATPAADRAEDPADDTETAAYAYASIPPAANAPGEPSKAARRRNAENRRGTLDLGLLVLRLVVGAIFLYHGLQKLTGWFHGPGLDGTRDMMADGGWDHPTLSTILLVVGEVGGGALLVLGLATPLAAGAVLAVSLNAWAWKQGMIPGFQFSAAVPTGVEIDSILAGAATAIILTGPGRWALDRTRGWATRPSFGSFAALVAAVVAAGLTFWYLHGGNPLTGIGPFG